MTESQHFSMSFLPCFYEILCSKKTQVPTSFYVPIFLCFKKSLGHGQILKNQGKNDRVPTFFYVKIFRWTQLMCKEIFG